MSNPWEKPTGNQKEEKECQKNHSDTIKRMLEHKIGKKLPEDKEELFRNFDALIPKEVGSIDIADTVKPDDKYSSLYEYSREGIRRTLERELYGATMEDVKSFFEKELAESDEALSEEQESIDRGYKKRHNSEVEKKHGKALESFNQLNFGSLEIPLADIELCIYESHSIDDLENDQLRKFAERLSAEIYKDRPKNDVNVVDIKKQIEKEAAYFSDAEDENTKKDNAEHFKKVLESLDKGNIKLAFEEIEFSIGWIQERLEERKNKDLKKVSEEMLKKRFGENFRPVANKELEKLRSYRKFLKFGESKNT